MPQQGCGCGRDDTLGQDWVSFKAPLTIFNPPGLNSKEWERLPGAQVSIASPAEPKAGFFLLFQTQNSGFSFSQPHIRAGWGPCLWGPSPQGQCHRRWRAVEVECEMWMTEQE